MKDNANFIEFATFFFIVAFSVTMTKMQWEHSDNIVQAEIDKRTQIQNAQDDLMAWNDRVTRIQSIGSINHDGDPNTTTIDTQVCAAGSDPDGDDFTYAWSTGATTACIDLHFEAGSHDYSVTVTDAYGATGTDNMNVFVNPEPNIFLTFL